MGHIEKINAAIEKHSAEMLDRLAHEMIAFTECIDRLAHRVTILETTLTDTIDRTQANAPTQKQRRG